MARAPRLDKSRAFGTVFPPVLGAVFYQDGYHFTEDGMVVRALCTPEQLAVLDGTPAPAPTPAVAAPAPAKGKPGRKPKIPAAQAEDGSDIDFELWLTGRQTATDAQIVHRARDLYGPDMETVEQVKEHLIHSVAIVPEHEVRI